MNQKHLKVMFSRIQGKGRLTVCHAVSAQANCSSELMDSSFKGNKWETAITAQQIVMLLIKHRPMDVV
jgi:hypothetical protein